MPSKELPTKAFQNVAAWDTWLTAHHDSSPGLWIKFAKKDSGHASVTYVEAIEVALTWGWIDGQKDAHDNAWWLQKFTRRGPRSGWSRINRAKAEALIVDGRMKPPGLAEVERAKADGRWASAYDSARTSTVPDDLAQALAANKTAEAFFETIDAANRYAVLYRVQTAKKPETRAARIEKLVVMLGRREVIHPTRAKKPRQ